MKVSENLENPGKNLGKPCKSGENLNPLSFSLNDVLKPFSVKVFIDSYTCLQTVLAWSE